MLKQPVVRTSSAKSILQEIHTNFEIRVDRIYLGSTHHSILQTPTNEQELNDRYNALWRFRKNRTFFRYSPYTHLGSDCFTMTDLQDCFSAPMDRLDAAHALLGVSPNTVFDPLTSAMSKDSNVYGSARPLGGLDALAALASSLEHHSTTYIASSNSSSSGSDDDSEIMPPPPPRRRLRSCSNPEGMEKWDSLSRINSRRRYVVPNCILEEELAQAKAAADKKNDDDRESVQRSRSNSLASLQEEEPAVEPEELLRRARSRLLEDLSEGSITGEKGQLTLPHALSKYKHVYNKNGRIGIYTPSERAAIIARFQGKRSRRVWNKKIRYNCRKNLADRRLRVKGRFVKRSNLPEKPPIDEDMPDINDPEAGFVPTEDLPYRRLRRHTIT